MLGRIPTGSTPTGSIGLTAGGSPPAAPPSGWLGQLSQAPKIVALPIAAAMSWCPQPITPAVAATPSLGWQAPLSAAPPVVRVAQSFSFVPFNTVQPSNSRTGLPWQQPLSKAVPVPPVGNGFSFVPFNTVQPAAVTITTGWQSPLSTAPKLAGVPYSQFQLVPRDNPPVPFGWQAPLSTAPQVARVPSYSATSFVVPPFVVPNGWQSALSVAPQPVARATSNYSYVPFGPAPFVSLAWQAPLSIAPRQASTSQSFAFVPFDTAQTTPSTIAGMAWFAPLSVAPPRQNLSNTSGPAIVFAPISGSITVPSKRLPTLFMSNLGRMMGS